MPEPTITTDLDASAPVLDEFSTTTRGNHRTHGDARSDGNHFIDKSCVVRQNIYCAKALEASAYTVRTSTYGDPEDPQFDPEHLYTTIISAGFIKNDVNGNFLFGQAGDGGATALDQLTDVTLTSPVGREYLCFDSGSSQWVNQVIVLDDLGDAVILSPADGDYLCFDGNSSKWINAGIVLDDLTDVSTAGAVSGNEVLQFDGASAFFFALLNLNSLSNVDLITSPPTSGDHLEFNGTDWVPGAPPAAGATTLNDLTDVTLTSPADGNVFQFDGSAWVNRADIELSSTAVVFIGDPAAAGTWRFVRSGTDLNFDRADTAGVFTNKGSFTA